MSAANEQATDALYDAAVAKINAGELMTKDEANCYFAESLVNPTNQVYFRAGLIACREYMARFVEAQSPEIAASIRANWWPQLGEDLGGPRRLRFDELTDGGEEGPWTLKDGISPTLEALPQALAFFAPELHGEIEQRSIAALERHAEALEMVVTA